MTVQPQLTPFLAGSAQLGFFICSRTSIAPEASSQKNRCGKECETAAPRALALEKDHTALDALLH
jgi:hypothetical protein